MDSALSTAATMSSVLVTSTLTNAPPISSARAAPLSSCRSATTTCAPRPANWRAASAPIPEAPHHILGVQNLRGTIVPIIDLRARIGMPSVEPSATTVIIVLSVETSAGARLFGIVVDGVSDVTNLTASSLRAVPMMNGGTAEYLRGLFSLGDTMILVLDIDKLLNDGGMTF